MSESRNSIVCALDFTPASDRALSWAITMARRSGGRLDLVHVVPPPSAGIDSPAVDARLLQEASREAAQQRLDAAALDIEARSGVPARAHLLEGEAASAICRAAREARATLIVVGTHGRSVVGRWILGSVAERTVRAADVPVAVIPPPPPDRPDAALAPLADGTPLRVLAGLALDAGDARVIAVVANWKARWSGDVTFLHLYWPQEEIARLGLSGPRDLLAPDRDVVADLEPALRQSLGPLARERGVHVLIKPAWGEPSANLLLAAQQLDADLIVVGAQERYGLARLLHPSVASALAHRTRSIPVIFVPVPEERHAAAPARTPLFSTILAPTDLSPAGNAAVRHAYALLRGRGGVVELCHIHTHGVPTQPTAYDDPRLRLSPGRRGELERELRALVPEDADGLGIVTHVSVLEGGDAATAIVQAAERLHVDAISMASHGRTGLVRALLGSVTEKVIHRTAKPVLVVHVDA